MPRGWLRWWVCSPRSSSSTCWRSRRKREGGCWKLCRNKRCDENEFSWKLGKLPHLLNGTNELIPPPPVVFEHTLELLPFSSKSLPPRYSYGDIASDLYGPQFWDDNFQFSFSVVVSCKSNKQLGYF